MPSEDTQVRLAGSDYERFVADSRGNCRSIRDTIGLASILLTLATPEQRAEAVRRLAADRAAPGSAVAYTHPATPAGPVIRHSDFGTRNSSSLPSAPGSPAPAPARELHRRGGAGSGLAPGGAGGEPRTESREPSEEDAPPEAPPPDREEDLDQRIPAGDDPEPPPDLDVDQRPDHERRPRNSAGRPRK